MRELLLAARLLEQSVDCDRLKRSHPSVHFIGLIGFDARRQEFVLLKSDPLSAPTGNNSTLSTREHEVLRLVADGCTNLQIARALTITENTVKTHLQNIFTKLKVRSRTEAAMYAVQQGWVSD